MTWKSECIVMKTSTDALNSKKRSCFCFLGTESLRTEAKYKSWLQSLVALHVLDTQWSLSEMIFDDIVEKVPWLIWA